MTNHRALALAWLDRAEHDHADRSDETLALSSAAIGILHALLAQKPPRSLHVGIQPHPTTRSNP